MSNLPAKIYPIPALFDSLGIPQVTSSDQFTLTYQDGLLEVNVKRSSGKVETAVKCVKNSGFSQITQFDPDRMNKKNRNQRIKSLYANGYSQNELAKFFGLSQAMICRIINS